MTVDLVPTFFAEHIRGLPAEGGPSGADWLDQLPALVSGLLDEWGLTPFADLGRDTPARPGTPAWPG